MKKFFLMLLMGISVMLSASPPFVDVPRPQFDGQQIQTFSSEVTNPVDAPEVAIIDTGDWLFSELQVNPDYCSIEATDEMNFCLEIEIYALKFLPEPVLLQPPGELRCCIENTDLIYRFTPDRQCSNYGYLSTEMQVFS